MGLNLGAVNNHSIIDAQALSRVTQKILNPENKNTVEVSKLDLSKFNRVSQGLDLYAPAAGAEKVLQAAKTAVDFDINLSRAFSANVQYLNSMAAQSLFTSKENTGKFAVNTENALRAEFNEALEAASNIDGASNLNKDRRGSNPFSFYMPASKKEKTENAGYNSGVYAGLNFFA